jgi:hypothetical protein
MSTLRNVNGASLIPDLSSPLATIQGEIEKTRAEEKRKSLNEQLSVIFGGLSEGNASQQAPVTSEDMTNDINRIQRIGEEAVSIRGLPDLVSKRTRIAQLAQEGLKKGEDISAYEDLLKESDPDKLNLKLTKISSRASNKGQQLREKQTKGKQEETALLRITQIMGPEFANSVRATLDRGDKVELEKNKSEVERRMREAAFVGEQETHQGMVKAITSLANQAKAEGRPIDEYIDLANKSEGQIRLELERSEVMGKELKNLFKGDEIKAPQTREIKRGGKIVTQEFNSATRKYEDIAEADRFKSDVLSPEAVAQKKEIAGASKSETLIQNEINNSGGKKEAEKLAESRVKRYESIRDTALAAEEQNAGLSQLENIDVSTGFGEGAKAQLSRAINALGGNGEGLTGVDPANVQAMNAVTGKLVLDVMSKQKGPQTDRDQDRIAKTLPNIANEKLANEFNLNSLKALNFRKIEMSDFYENYLEEHETLKGADREWSKFKRSTPLLSNNVKNPETGLPMFFHEFKSKAQEKNPNATNGQLIKAWRELSNGK